MNKLHFLSPPRRRDKQSHTLALATVLALMLLVLLSFPAGKDRPVHHQTLTVNR